MIPQISLKNRFIVSFAASLPMLVEMVLAPLTGFKPPGHTFTMFALTTIVMLIAAGPFVRTAWAAFKNHTANMDTLIAIGTGTAYIYSIYAMLNEKPVFFEVSAFVITFILLGQLLEEAMKSRASMAIKKLLELQAKEAEVFRNGEFLSTPLERVVSGDVIRVKPGQKVPVDGVILEGVSSINESMVTGESMPVSKKQGDSVIGSTLNTTGSFTFTATKVGSETLLAGIVELVKKAQVSRAPIQKTVDKISHIFVPTVLIIAALTFVVWFVFLGADFAAAMLYAVAVVIIACPCALGLATPTALMVGAGLGAKKGILIKSGDALEAAKNIKTVAFDKTGTITKGQPVVTDVIGNKSRVLLVAATLERSSEHPLAQAVVNAANEHGVGAGHTIATDDFKAIEGMGVTASLDGEVAFVGNQKLLTKLGVELRFADDIARLEEEAKTVVYVGRAGKVVGLIAIQDTPKPTAANAIKALKKKGLLTVMITGDNDRVARAIANAVGIDDVIAGVLPEDKASHVSRLQHSGNVAFVGDGINDAPALATATLGIAMGSGTDIAIESGDVVLVKDDPYDVVRALNLSQKTFSRIKLNLFWAFIYNTLGIPIAAGLFVWAGINLSPELAGLAMAFSSVSVVISSLLLNKVRLN